MTDANIELLRNNIEFVSIAQFFHTFQSAFRPWGSSTSRDVDLSSRSHRKHRAAEPEEDEYTFATEDLENMLLDDSERFQLKELIIRMLKLMTRNRFINNETWQMYFSRELGNREPEEPNPLLAEKKDDEPTTEINTEKDADSTRSGSVEPKQPDQETVDFFRLSLDTRVHLLNLLCEWQLDDPERFRQHLDGEEDAVHWRVNPVGYDAKGSTFWLFDDNRLYKETPEPKQKRGKSKAASKQKKKQTSARRSSRRSGRNVTTDISPAEVEESEEDMENWVPWKLVCRTREEWEAFPEKYAKSSNTDEQRFHKLLVNDLVPKIIPVLEEIEKRAKMQEAIVHRKRSSRLLVRELEALEQSQSFILEGGRRTSGRREEMARKREEREKETAAKAREERLLERERRTMERIQAQIEDEKQQEKEEMQEKLEGEKPTPRKRGRKPKPKYADDEEETWAFDCVCGVSGRNIDDGSPMIACEGCGTWQHIKCLQNSGQIDRNLKSLNNVSFMCRRCKDKEMDESGEVDIDGLDDDHGARQNGHADKKPRIQPPQMPFSNRIQPLLNPLLPHMPVNGQMPPLTPQALQILQQQLLQQQQQQQQQQQRQQQPIYQSMPQPSQQHSEQHSQQHSQQQPQQHPQHLQPHLSPQRPLHIQPQPPQLHSPHQQTQWGPVRPIQSAPTIQPTPLNGQGNNTLPPMRIPPSSAEPPRPDSSRYPPVHPAPTHTNGQATAHNTQYNSQQNPPPPQGSHQLPQ